MTLTYSFPFVQLVRRVYLVERLFGHVRLTDISQHIPVVDRAPQALNVAIFV